MRWHRAVARRALEPVDAEPAAALPLLREAQAVAPLGRKVALPVPDAVIVCGERLEAVVRVGQCVITHGLVLLLLAL